jgi:hypothetical protein
MFRSRSASRLYGIFVRASGAATVNLRECTARDSTAYETSSDYGSTKGTLRSRGTAGSEDSYPWYSRTNSSRPRLIKLLTVIPSERLSVSTLFGERTDHTPLVWNFGPCWVAHVTRTFGLFLRIGTRSLSDLLAMRGRPLLRRGICSRVSVPL